ncbi:MAG: peptidase M20 [Acidobacteria bacterium 13_1_40CM_3_56_11]|nr:MAG: peptidase M20 [Acidobacteria bacterium 13_1_40CM_56_16]OLD17056.1 MAG: peptidase M20 [Acidobacteria bacterium 13_1_40CM_3_56_11]OLD67579.1 MAG: peptidase M20 [Acidobacteria bacterium 13_1_40CM_2_56_11]
MVRGTASAQTGNVQRLLVDPKFQAAQEFIAKDHDRFVRETIQITEIEAPPFKEAKRAKAFVEMLRQSGLSDVDIDAEGNVIGLRRGTGTGPLIAIAAHLDTVFPEGTNVKVRREGSKLYAPGVGDDSRAVAVLLEIVRAMDSAKIQTSSDILFVADVGEEGPGDLRGMKYLFQKGPYKDKIKMFISLDPFGWGSDITTAGMGSKRFKVIFTGPGGHSFGSFGLVNPAYALGNAIAKLSKMQVPQRPKTTYNVGVVGGGTSVNSIPFESWMEVDIRSETKEELNRAVENFTRLMHEAVEEENRARSTSQGKIEIDVKLIGDRPFGEIFQTAPIVQTAAAVIRALGMVPTFGLSSTDANIPLSMGIPAITLESGGTGSRNHTLDEWIDVEKTASVRGIHIAMGVLLALAGMN